MYAPFLIGKAAIHYPCFVDAKVALLLHSEDLAGYQPNMYEGRWWCLTSGGVPRSEMLTRLEQNHDLTPNRFSGFG